ncbi:penicillin-binding protein, partial [Mycobacterium sp. ITM-2017-0098]
IDPKTGGVKAYYGGSDANGFDFAQAGLPTGSSFKVFALVAALGQGMGLGYQVDSSPVEVNGIKISNVEGGSCGTCNIAEALKRSL